MLDYRTRTFLEVHRLGSFTRAAEALHITQPAVSQHIRHLEAHYNCALFARQGHAIVPTAAGDLLFQQLSALENDEMRLQADLAALSSPCVAHAPLRFGCTRTIGEFVAPAVLARHLAAHPDERIIMRDGNTRELVAAIADGELDFALIEGSFDRELFDSELFSHEPYVAVTGADDAGRNPDEPTRPRSLADLLDRTLLLREAGSGTREILEKHLAARDLTVSDFAAIHEMGSIPAIKACAQAGIGVAFLYRAAVERELAEGTLVDITPADFAIEHDFRLIWQRGSRYAPRYRALAAAWRKHAQA